MARIILLSLLAIFLFSSARADDVYLKDGTVYRNIRSAEIAGSNVRFEIKPGKLFQIPLTEVARIDKIEVTQDLQIKTERYYGELPPAPGAILYDAALISDTILDTLYTDRTDERLVPFDTVNRVDKIDENLETKLHLFPQYKGFTESYLLQLSDTLYALEVWRRTNDVLSKSRMLMTKDQMLAMQQSISSALHTHAPTAGINQSGRPLFLGNIYTLSLGIYGWGIPYLLNLEKGVAVGTYLLIGASGILIAQSATERAEITEEMANLSFYGSVVGITHGVLVPMIADDGSSSVKTYVGSVMVFSTIEGTAGYLFGKNLRLSSGAVEMIGTMSAAGLIYGWGTSNLLDLNGTRQRATAMLIGSVVGTTAGLAFFSDRSYTNGDVGVFRGAWLLGGYVPCAVLVAANVSGSKPYIGSAMAGGVIGGIIGNALVKGRDFETSEGTYIMFGTFGGMLIGGGVPLVLGASGEAAVALSAAGGMVGFGLMYDRYQSAARQRNANSALSIGLHPENLLLLTQVPPLSYDRSWTIPLLRILYTF